MNYKSTIYALIIANLIYVISGIAMPPKPNSYDENGLHIITGNPLPDFPEWFGQPGSLNQRLEGTGSSVAVLIDFPDRLHSPSHPESAYDELLYSDDSYPTGSLRDYYQETSYGLYDVEGEAYGWYTTPDNYYNNYNDGNHGLSWGGSAVASKAAELSDPYVDYGNYDNDGPDGIPNSGDDDGYVDLFLVFHADPGGEDTGNPNDIWSHKSSIYYTTNDPRNGGGFIRISDYAIQPEEKPDESIITISVICHEFGHVLGLPDLYDYSRWTLGIGIWGLMGYGAWGGDGLDGRYPSHLCAWCKEELDWVDPTVITENEDDLLLRPVEQYPDVYKIWRNGSPGQEYFLIANRQNVGFDLKLKGTGILVWHIDNTIYEAHNAVDLEEADGLDDLEHGDGERPDPLTDNIGDDGDPYPGSSNATEFSPTSYPNSDDNDGVPTDITIRDFQISDINLTCDVILNTSGDEGDEGTIPGVFALYPPAPNPSDGNATIRFALPEKADVELSVFDIKGRKVSTVVNETLDAGKYDAVISGLSGGVYLYWLQAGDYGAVEKMIVK